MSRHPRAGFAVVAVSLMCGAIVPTPLDAQDHGAQPDTPLQPAAIGLLRSDGILFPLAHLRRQKWEPLNVVDQSDYSSRLNKEGRALARTGWFAFPLDGKSAFPLTIRGVVQGESHCTGMEGLRTDAPPVPFPADTWPRPKTKTAIAVFGQGQASRGERLEPPYDADARRASSRIVGLTQSAEKGRARTNSFFAGLSAGQRDRTPVRITTLVRDVAPPGVTRYFFEARKQYSAAIILYVTGWLVESERGMEAVEVHDEMPDDGDGKGDVVLQLLGLVTLQDRTVWLLVEYGYESEAYEVIDFSSGRPLAIRIDAGSC